MGILWKLVLAVGLLAQSPGGDWFDKQVFSLDASEALADPAVDFAVQSIADQIGLIGVVPFFTRAVALVVDGDQKRRPDLGLFPRARLIKRQLRFGSPFPIAKQLSVSGYEDFPACASILRKFGKSLFHFCKWQGSSPNQFPSDAKVFGDHRPFVGQIDLGLKLEGRTFGSQDGGFDGNRYPWALGLLSDSIRVAHGLRGFAGVLNRLSGQVNLPKKARSADAGNYGPNHRPYCSALSGVCGLPLSAKVALTPILALLAWACQERFLDRLWGLGKRGRRLGKNRWAALGWFSLSLLLFAAVFAVWLWGSTNA